MQVLPSRDPLAEARIRGLIAKRQLLEAEGCCIPVDLQARELPVIQVEASWFRIHKTRHSPLYYGRFGKNRFDAPAQEYGVMYVALDPHGAYIETFGSQTGIRVVSTDELSIRSISELTCKRPLKLVDITGPGVVHLGADGRLATGAHRVAQGCARALWSHPVQVNGIYYPARHDLSQHCAAIFDRAKSVFDIANTQGCISRSFSKTLATILNTYQFGLVD